MKISIILPCRNEEKALPLCLADLKKVIRENNLDAEIIVSDSSVDNSPKIAKKFNVRLIKHDKDGYGNAYLEGLKIAKGKYIVMLDADYTYDPLELPKLINKLEEGYDFVIGNRFSKEMEKGAMPAAHKYLGNPLLSATLRLFFGAKVKDCHSGFRAIRREKLEQLNLKTTGMEFASEMIIQSIKHKLKIFEIPIKYRKRIGKSKLKTFSDGWRHLRFMLIYSPLYLFFIPGGILFFLGILLLTLIYTNNLSILGVDLIIHPMFLFSAMTIVGYQSIFFGLFAKTYAYTRLGEKNKFLENFFELFSLEKALLIGSILFFGGILTYGIIFINWTSSGFGALNEIKNSVVALTFIVLGFQTIFSAFMMSLLSIKEK
ncbi:glycosyltransferase family 2 protein [Candidatus Pacearchaeota archaeon]|nr:glycosyltransferase family 2 protein [Candidatus Pacearchaeota archaeon]